MHPHPHDGAALRGDAPSIAAPLRRASEFVERIAALTAAEWADVAQRALALDAAAHPAAVRRLWHALIGHPQSRALDALNRAACAAASAAAVASPGFAADQAQARAGRTAAHAALAVALAPELPPGDVALLTAPFRAAGGEAVAPRGGCPGVIAGRATVLPGPRPASGPPSHGRRRLRCVGGPSDGARVELDAGAVEHVVTLPRTPRAAAREAVYRVARRRRGRGPGFEVLVFAEHRASG
jgi:hypothetical protein